MRLPSAFARSSRRSRPACLAVVVAVSAAACSGPQAPLNVGAKSVPLDMILGVRKAVAGAPVPPFAFALDPSGLPTFDLDLGQPSPPRRARPPVTLPTGCVVNPLAVPATVAPDKTLFLAPGKHAYTYRASGSWKTGGADAVEHRFPDAAEVEVVDAASDLATLQSTWKVAVSIAGSTTTTSYRARNPGLARYVVEREIEKNEQLNQTPAGSLTITLVEEPAADAPPDTNDNYHEGESVTSNPEPAKAVKTPPHPAPEADETAQPTRGLHNGLYIERIETTGQTAFQPPAPGLLLARFPLIVGTVFDVVASDGVTTMAYRTTVKPKATVHACHVALDTWTIELTQGSVVKVETGEVVNFTARYQVATQFGGLIVDDFTEVEGKQVTVQGDLSTLRRLRTTATTAPLSFTSPTLTPGPPVTAPPSPQS